MGGGLNSHNIFAEIISLGNLFLAWKEFKKGKSKKRNVQEFEFNLEDNLFLLCQELADKSYQHSDYTSFYITDPKLRHIHKACVRDRVLHHAIFRVLYPIFDKLFIFDSYSCRLSKGHHQAVKRLKIFCDRLSRNNSRNIFALKCDIKKFFDSVDQSVLLDLIKKTTEDTNAIWLIEKVIKSFETKKGKGLPIGNVTSQLFANIYLNKFDQFVKHSLKAKHYIRYCDDFVILSESKNKLEKFIDRIGGFLEDNLKLSLHPQKVTIRKCHQGIDFLGYVIRPYCINLRTKTKRRTLRKVNQNNLASYLGVLKHCHGHKIKKTIDGLIKNRAVV